MPDLTDFSELDLRRELFDNLADLGYIRMTPVQARTLPLLIAGKDVLARAKTGSGKTAAFGLGILNALDAGLFRVQVLVLCPTRELADQVAGELRRLARAIPNIKIMSICGGAPLRRQKQSLQRSPHVIVGTPGRVHKHLRDGTIELPALQTLVLDEADRMLDMGFADELQAILAFVPEQRQTLLFSATYPDEIADISAKVQRKPTLVDVTDDDHPLQLAESWCPASRENRGATLVRALRAWGGSLNLVFCNTRVECDAVARHLQREGIAALALHGDMQQAQRNQTLVRFSNRSVSVLVATDVAARGLDVKNIDAVFNVGLPAQNDVYVHRIGRTGRAGKAGIAVSLVDDSERWRLDALAEARPDANIAERNIPDTVRDNSALAPRLTTLEINGGRKNKLRPGDLLGALTANGGVPGDAVGSIDLFDSHAYVAIQNAHLHAAARQLNEQRIKGRRYRARVRR